MDLSQIFFEVADKAEEIVFSPMLRLLFDFFRNVIHDIIGSIF